MMCVSFLCKTLKISISTILTLKLQSLWMLWLHPFNYVFTIYFSPEILMSHLHSRHSKWGQTNKQKNESMTMVGIMVKGVQVWGPLVGALQRSFEQNCYIINFLLRFLEKLSREKQEFVFREKQTETNFTLVIEYIGRKVDGRCHTILTWYTKEV